MNILCELDFNDYCEHWEKELRIASRAIIELNDKLILIKSDKYGEYKFPGGGIKINESVYDALVRETNEETGLEIDLSTIEEFGTIIEKRKKFGYNTILYQLSFYFKCNVTEKVGTTSLDAFEKELGYKLVIEDPSIALQSNNEKVSNSNIPWVKRESFILSLLSNRYKSI